MVTNKPPELSVGPTLDQLFGALADPTRRVILDRLTRGEATVGELARPFDMSRPAISKHLRVLERAGLVHREIDGRRTRCTLRAAPLEDVAEWTERYRRYWEGQLDRFADYLDDRTDSPQPQHDSEENPE